MRRAAWVGCLGLALTFVVGCPPPKADDRPGRTDFDDGGRSSVVTLRGGTGGAGGTAGSASATGGEPTEWPTTTLNGQVWLVNEFNSDPAPTVPFVNAAEDDVQVDVVAEGRDSDTTAVGVSVDSPFELAEVREAEAVWVRVSTDDATMMGALHQVDTTEPATHPVYVVQRLLIEDILDRSPAGISLNRDRAQIVLRVIDQSRQGVDQVVVGRGGSEILYRQLNVWDGAATSTDSSGLALVANVGATAAVGSFAEFTVGAKQVTVPVYPDTVTLVEVTYP
jgi:hypothetical protein